MSCSSIPTGAAAKRYNVLQRLAYLSVIGLITLMVLTGLTMSPGSTRLSRGCRMSSTDASRHAASISSARASLCFCGRPSRWRSCWPGAINEVRSMLTGLLSPCQRSTRNERQRDITRRAVILAGFGSAGFLVCQRQLADFEPKFRARISRRRGLDRANQRALLLPDQFAKEYKPADISPNSNQRHV